MDVEAQPELDRLIGKCQWLQRQNDDLVAKNKSLKRIMHIYHGLYRDQIERQREEIETLRSLQSTDLAKSKRESFCERFLSYLSIYLKN
jgi:hypothetical protein